MNSRYLFALRLPSLLLAATLQVLPIARTALPAAQTTANLMAIILRWGAGLAAALGGVQAVSGASTVITTPLNQTVTNGVKLGNSQIRLTTAPEQAGYWLAVGLPGGLYVTNTSSTAFYIRGTPTETGDFSVSLTAKENATSNKERTTTSTMIIHVLPGAGANSPPAANGQNVSTAEDTAKAITLTGSDPDGNPLTYTIVSQPAHGTISGSPPSVTYTPTANYNGADSFTFKVNDGTVDSPTATVSITVTAVNDPPVADAQSVSTAEDTARAITLTGSDVEGSPLTYSIITQPLHGSLSGTAPNITYTPAANYSGSDSFSFKVNDGTVDSAVATVSIAIALVNQAPTATAQNVSTAEDSAKAITLTGTDPDGNPLTYTIVSPPVHGALAGAVPNVTFTPAANFNGADSFTFKVNDGTVDSPTATVSINVTAVNDPPVADPQNVTTDQDVAKSITLTGSDVEGSPLTYSIITQPLHGSLSGSVPNVTYTPAANYSGSDSFSFKVNDGTADSLAATVAIAIAGAVAPPTLSFAQPSILPGNVSMNATGSAGLTWTIERAPEPTGPWTSIGNLVIGAGGAGQFSDPNPPAGGAFYRATKN